MGQQISLASLQHSNFMKVLSGKSQQPDSAWEHFDEQLREAVQHASNVPLAFVHAQVLERSISDHLSVICTLQLLLCFL